VSGSPEEVALLFRRRFAVVEEIQGLNARHLKAQQVAGGVAFALLQAEAGGDTDGDGEGEDGPDAARLAALVAEAEAAEAECAACAAALADSEARLDEIDRLIAGT